MTLWKYILGLLTLTLVGISLALFQPPDGNLHIVACDVGQGDAFLISKGDRQILVDGGPSKRVLDCLARNMPFWDRTIELVVLTHPQFDHFGGLIDVFASFKVDNFLANPVDAKTASYEALKEKVAEESANVINPKEGRKLRVGMMYLDILRPADEILAGFERGGNLNEISIVFGLKFGDFDALFTGDIETKISDTLADNLSTSDIDWEYLKVPHHGSKNGLTEKLLEAVSPEVAVISAGHNNRYGHPHEETLEILRYYDIEILRTDQEGDIEIVTDGRKWWIK